MVTYIGRFAFVFIVICSLGALNATALEKKPAGTQQLTGGECTGLGGDIWTRNATAEQLAKR